MLKELTIRQNYLGTYRVYKFDETFYIYVQQYGYNIMLKDTKTSWLQCCFYFSRFYCPFTCIYAFIWDFK